jgi:hypothetical protein
MFEGHVATLDVSMKGTVFKVAGFCTIAQLNRVRAAGPSFRD